MFAALLPARERVSGPEHPDTLRARGRHAYWTGLGGDPAAARDQHAALLPAYEQVLGPDHPDTLRARANLAHWTGEAGDAAAARDMFAALLPARERVSGPDHPDTLTARHELARPRPSGYPDRPARTRPVDGTRGRFVLRSGPVGGAAACALFSCRIGRRSAVPAKRVSARITQF
jgi:hypothetical protein